MLKSIIICLLIASIYASCPNPDVFQKLDVAKVIFFRSFIKPVTKFHPKKKVLGKMV